MWPLIVAAVDAFLWTKTSVCHLVANTENEVEDFPIIWVFTANGWYSFALST